MHAAQAQAGQGLCHETLGKSVKGAYVALAAVVVLAWALWPDAPPDQSVEVSMRVEGPEGVIWNGTALGATPVAALLDAANSFEVVAVGSGAQAFVTAIDGHRNEGAGGWCYAVWQDGWFHPVVGAGVWELQEGDRLWWHYVPEGCPVA